MGWTSYPMHEPIKEWFRKQWDFEGSKCEVIDSALVQRHTLYGAVKMKETGEVFCCVYLIRWSRNHYNFSYKDMTEHVGPCECACPMKIFKLLTPLTGENDGYAKDWRERVLKYWDTRNTINSGGIIKTEKPVPFISGDEYQYFKKIGRTTWAGMMMENEFRPLCRVRVNLARYNIEKITEKSLAVS